ncbi:uncharacterized protein MELLADRAFT_108783 [Melampsora larici-populina 98AG31]|uniref:Uncharacterized protein n=1 Tax=Melampsora larici-populina (strain 98AG31 / pathotype 3-4-7) TaxID=747676 RepID=F4RU85_MELLP|nr:uncharacterized protein MELLADRAFT_108783 [Melampsora larici-populina 98AG31]EGG03893.1 hypothetical protein MELLADRAFT_108783 [Melampsora larici-populina 98AG31]
MLRGLYAVSFTHQLGDVALLDFPNLQVIRTHFLPEQPESGVDWLHLPVLMNVRTIVADIYSGEKYWQWAPKSASLNALKGVPNLKHIVFTKDENIESHTITPTFFEAVQSLGIRCRVTQLLTPSEVMQLDYELNGPM